MSKKTPQIRFKGFTDDWEERKFKDILKTYSFRSYLANASDHGKYEVIQQGDNPLVGYSDGIPFMDYKDIILFGDHTVSLYKPQSPFFISTDGVKILSADNFEGNYLYTTLERYKPNSQGYKRHFTILKNQELWFTRNVEEQQKVGSFFKQLDNTIALHQRKLDLLKEQKKGYLQKMFPKNGAKVPELRFAGFADDWEERKLGDEVRIVMGQSPNSENYTDDPNDYILVQGNADMKNGRVFPRVWTTQVTKQAEKDDLILSVRAPVGDIGKTAYDVVIGRGVAAIKGNEFIFQNLGKMKSDGYWTRYSTGSTFESINSTDIKEAIISVPAIEEQNKIGSFFKQLDNTIALHQRKLDLLKEQKKGFLQKMFVS
ncbi:restriction endonuclease subunit S [Leuconostoc lactis]|uniref:restriction endonuclease subunit S n=1 Tax=Leuconostoc lactis TaxID=1246 RepID=UPI003B28C7BD